MSVKEYLETLQWDGKPRIATFFTDYATGANEFDATKWFVSAVARAMDPGCRIDTHLVICGPEGSGKTRLLIELFGEIPSGIGDFEIRSKCWIIESEFGFVANDKPFLTATHDTFRARYQGVNTKAPRTCIVVATDNNTKRITKALKSGSRRFWPVTITSCAASKIAADRDQLWAEAKHHFDNGSQWWD
jgi:putative DNA primase/helicase